ncbi:MAG: hypothetical protein BGO14_07850 [Chlamydiales bacterium 38-26]|nr:GNAT family N-acetyltransferase [Chlamydiales bacterium]OJV10910.1 MAG: hypothetical protein BGO14_07850 [Chlamydiales bacterium 38-26]
MNFISFEVGRNIDIRVVPYEDVEIKPLHIDHIENIQELLVKGSDESGYTLISKEIVSNYERFKPIVLKWSESTYEFNLGAFVKDKSSLVRLVGHIHFRVALPFLDKVKHIGSFNILILREYWGLGIGKKLMEAMISRAKTMGIKRIEAQVVCNNQRAVNLYLKCGFSIEGTRKNSFYDGSHYLDEFFIAKLIE